MLLRMAERSRKIRPEKFPLLKGLFVFCSLLTWNSKGCTFRIKTVATTRALTNRSAEVQPRHDDFRRSGATEIPSELQALHYTEVIVRVIVRVIPYFAQLRSSRTFHQLAEMSSLLRTVNRTTSRQLQQRSCSRYSAGRSNLPPPQQPTRTSIVYQSPKIRSTFSTMAVLKSNAPATGGVREFDPEIKYMASYIHNYKIDSDLAVCDSHSKPA